MIVVIQVIPLILFQFLSFVFYLNRNFASELVSTLASLPTLEAREGREVFCEAGPSWALNASQGTLGTCD